MAGDGPEQDLALPSSVAASGDEEDGGDPSNADPRGGEEAKAKPLSPRNPPNWDEVKKMNVGAAREPWRPEYSSSLADEQWTVYDSTPELEYRQRISRLLSNDRGDPERLVRGRVFEIIGNERIPLAGIMVYDWNGKRTFSDYQGRFEFRAYWSEPPEEDKKEGQKYRVYLRAKAPGYIDFNNSERSYSNLDETEHGFELYVARRGNHRIRIRFDNPQVAGGPVTVILSNAPWRSSGGPSYAVDWDDQQYIKAEVDPSEEVWFIVPVFRFRYLNEKAFTLRSVSAPNILADVKSLVTASKSEEELEYVVKLLVEDTVTISGTAVDLQTGKPIPHACVAGPGETEYTVADEQGRFGLITSKTPRGPDGQPLPDDESRYMYVSGERYATMVVRVKDSSLHTEGTGRLVLGPGGNLSGPWTFQMRRWVEATVDCTFLASESRAEAKLELVYNAGDPILGPHWPGVDADGFCRFPRIPWGTKTLRLQTRTPFAVKELAVQPSSWDGEGPYRLVLEE